jgi:hypothetical protein
MNTKTGPYLQTSKDLHYASLAARSVNGPELQRGVIQFYNVLRLFLGAVQLQFVNNDVFSFSVLSTK